MGHYMQTLNNLSYEKFKFHCSEFFELSKQEGISTEELYAGQKAISLMWLRRSKDWTELDLYQSEILLRLVSRGSMMYEINKKPSS